MAGADCRGIVGTWLGSVADRLATMKVARMTPDLNPFWDYQNEIYLNGPSR